MKAVVQACLADYKRGMLKALESFVQKCGIGNLFAPARFSQPPKGPALAREAVWAACLEPGLLDVSTAMTPGQIATVCDAAPAIIGDQDLLKLEACQNLREFEDFIVKNHSNWETGVVVASQTWSVFHVATGNVPKDLFYNSNLQDRDYAILGIVSQCLDRNTLNNNPFAVYRLISGDLPDKIALTADKGQYNENPQTDEDRAATFIALCRGGSFDLASRCIVVDFQKELDGAETDLLAVRARVMEVAKKEDVITEDLTTEECEDIALVEAMQQPRSRGGNNGFIGIHSIEEMRTLSFSAFTNRNSDDSFVDCLRRTPVGHAVIREASKYAATGNVPDDDLLCAGIKGYYDALNHYSAIITPKVSMTKVKSDLAYGEMLPDFEDSRILPYTCSRFPNTYSDSWGMKALLLAAQDKQLVVDPELIETRKQLMERAQKIVEAEECSMAEALEVAGSEMRTETLVSNPNNINAINYKIEQAINIYSHGETVSLDRNIGESSRSGYDFVSDDRKEDFGKEDQEAGVSLDEEPIEFLSSSRDSQIHTFTSDHSNLSKIINFPSSFTGGINVTHKLLCASPNASTKDLAERFAAMACPAAQPPGDAEFEKIHQILDRSFPNQKTSINKFIGLMKNTADFFTDPDNKEQLTLGVIESADNLGQSVVRRLESVAKNRNIVH